MIVCARGRMHARVWRCVSSFFFSIELASAYPLPRHKMKVIQCMRAMTLRSCSAKHKCTIVFITRISFGEWGSVNQLKISHIMHRCCISQCTLKRGRLIVERESLCKTRTHPPFFATITANHRSVIIWLSAHAVQLNAAAVGVCLCAQTVVGRRCLSGQLVNDITARIFTHSRSLGCRTGRWCLFCRSSTVAVISRPWSHVCRRDSRHTTPFDLLWPDTTSTRSPRGSAPQISQNQ